MTRLQISAYPDKGAHSLYSHISLLLVVMTSIGTFYSTMKLIGLLKYIIFITCNGLNLMEEWIKEQFKLELVRVV